MDLAINRFFEKREFNVDEVALQKAFSQVFDMFTEHFVNLRPLTVDESLAGLPSDTSAGLPFKSGVRKGEVKEQIKRLAKKQWREVSRGGKVQFTPCRAGARRQLRERGFNKPRLVWAYPGYITALENQFVAPFMQEKTPSFLGWSINWMDHGKTLNRLINPFGWNSCAQIDFSSYDASVSPVLIRMAFEVIRGCMQLSETETVMLRQLEAFFIHTPLVYYNKVLVKHRGIPSGSSFTQLVGSICNMFACYYCSFRSRYYKLREQLCCWLGDDSLLFFDEGMAREEFSDDYLEYFQELGLSVSVDKSRYVVNTLYCSIRDPIKFLGREVARRRNGNFIFDRDKLSAQVVWPEEPDRSKYDTAARLIGLVWAYGMHLPYYCWYKSLFEHLSIKDSKKILPKRSVVRFVSLFVGKGIDFTTFPTFEVIRERYYGISDGIVGYTSKRTKNAPVT